MTSAPAKRVRLAAAERRAALLDAACRVFSERSYRGTTTAAIAAAAGVSEPILYRHFSGKRELYLACMEEAWRRTRSRWTEVVEKEPNPSRWVSEMGRASRESGERVVISRLWVGAMAEATEDEAIRQYIRRHLREVHAFITDVHRRAQEAKGIAADRNPRAEAWVFLSLGLMRMVSDTVDPLIDEDLRAVAEARRRWLTGA
jgi:TetR/AcrR family transcriptional regulator